MKNNFFNGMERSCLNEGMLRKTQQEEGSCKIYTAMLGSYGLVNLITPF
ncbi:MAG: hypothetical protein FWG65_01375 [Turicibacter sp.]|nr:hypothetical protein [Turicibacter sp.]